MAGKQKSGKKVDTKKLTFKLGTFDEQHRRNVKTQAQKVDKIYQQAVAKVTRAAQRKVAGAKEDGVFRFSDFPALDKAVDGFIREMGKSLQLNIEQGDKDAWTLANTKNDCLVDTISAGYGIPRKRLESMKHPHLEALQAFMERTRQGMNLSSGGTAEDTMKGVWNLAQFKDELEMALSTGIGKGKSAAELGRDVRQYLKHPGKLFRRVRDKEGNLRLSKAAAAFHPGRGIYRSSYKNALRLTATENNIAYRTSDYTRWNNLPFILGIQTHLSNNHTLNGKPFYDICDEFDGAKFPVEFKFTGWHPFCRCFATTILAGEEEREDYFNRMARGEDVSNYKFSGKVEEMPPAFRDWVSENHDRIANAKSMPYFLKDNPQFLEAAGYKIPKAQRKFFAEAKQEAKAVKVTNEQKEKKQDETKNEVRKIELKTGERGKSYTTKSIFEEVKLYNTDKAAYTRSVYTSYMNDYEQQLIGKTGKFTDLGRRTELASFVDENKIIASQKYVDKEVVDELVRSFNDNYGDIPTGYRLPDGTGKVYLNDGHHRVAAQIIMGKKKIKMIVVDIPKGIFNKS